MTDVSVAADAAPAQSSAPINPNPVDQPSPVDASFADAKADAGATAKIEADKAAQKPVSIRDSLKAADAKAKVEAAKPVDKAAPVKTEAAKAEPVKVEAATRAPDGKFLAKEGTSAAQAAAPVQQQADQSKPASDAPARFSEDAKPLWKDTPEPVRREAERAIRELTQGHEKYRTAAERDTALAPFHERAAKSGTDLKTALSKYVGMEDLLRQNPLRGLEEICSNVGLSLRDVAAHITGQTPDQRTSQSDATIRELKQQINQLTQQIGGVTQSITQQKEAATLSEIQKFAQDKPRFDELADDIGMFLSNGRAKDLQEAYDLADRLNPGTVSQAPAIVPATAASSAPVIDLLAQTQKGSKSIAGAPTPGSSPAQQERSSSVRDALKRAAARAG